MQIKGGSRGLQLVKWEEAYIKKYIRSRKAKTRCICKTKGLMF
jgi:hypothetical protein